MSRIGKLPVEIPQGVKVNVTADQFTVEGPKGSLTQSYKPEVSIAVDGSEAVVTRKDDSKIAKSYHGLYRQLLTNMVEGVTKGFSKTLVINGVGYRAEVKGNILMLNLGFSSQIEYYIEDGITITAEGPGKVTISGINKERVGQVAAEIRSLRKPEPYKGKGIKYEHEQIRRKVGKSGVK